MASGITFLAVIHIIVAILLITMVLLQDGKGGGMGGAFGGGGGGGGSQSLFGASGATNLLVRMTRYLAITFMVLCVAMVYLLNRSANTSVTDSMPLTAPAATETATEGAPAEKNTTAEPTQKQEEAPKK